MSKTFAGKDSTVTDKKKKKNAAADVAVALLSKSLRWCNTQIYFGYQGVEHAPL